MSVLPRWVAKQAWRSALFVSALVVGCAESSQDGKLDEGTLTGAGTSGSGGGGTAGTATTSGTGGGGAPGSAGTSGASTSGSAGMAGGGASSGGGGVGGAGGAGGAAGGGAMNGGSGGASGSGGSGGQAADGFRYAKLVATSEQTGKVWSSCAELKLFTSAGAEIPQNTWTVTADSEETDDESTPASAVKDGDINTFWHTSWEPGGAGDAPLPHHLIVDTGKLQAITGFSYLPRQEGTNGRIANWEFYLSKDGTTWGAAVKTGAFPAGLDAQKISL